MMQTPYATFRLRLGLFHQNPERVPLVAPEPYTSSEISPIARISPPRRVTVFGTERNRYYQTLRLYLRARFIPLPQETVAAKSQTLSAIERARLFGPLQELANIRAGLNAHLETSKTGACGALAPHRPTITHPAGDSISGSTLPDDQGRFQRFRPADKSPWGFPARVGGPVTVTHVEVAFPGLWDVQSQNIRPPLISKGGVTCQMSTP